MPRWLHESIRRAAFAAIALAFATSAAAKSSVVVIHGEASNSAPSERRFAQSLANHAVRWMKDGGVAVDQDTDKNLASALSGRKVAILVYCATPTGKQIAELRSFVKKGGRLIVTYSSSPELASVVGVKVGKYSRDPSRAMMVFGKDAPENCEREIRQSSPNIVEAFPVARRSRVIAWWADVSGKRLGDAAWLEGDGGYWMTHVLLADGDATQKGALLLSLAASIDPSLWKEAAANRIAKSGAIGRWKGLADARAAIGAMKSSVRRDLATRGLAEASTALKACRQLVQEGRHREAWVVAGELGACMRKAYGLAQEPRQGEIRAVWDHNGCGLYPGDWNRTCRELAEAGITDIFLNTASAVSTNCRLGNVPPSAIYERFGDQLAACLAAARPLGIRVHAWLFCFSTTGATRNRIDILRKDGWLVDATGGGQQEWLDPSSAAVRSRLTAIATEIMGKYKVDGIHLDFVRYQDYYGSLGYGTRVRYERDENEGKPIKNWPEAAKKAPLFRQVVRWRGRQVTALVAAIRAAQRKTAPGITVSAAVLGKYPTCVESVGQDWFSWLDCGYLDYAMPMNYTESDGKYAELLAVQMKDKKIARKVVGGIGVTASESRLDAGKVIDQIDALRKGGAAGFILFDLDNTLSNEILPILGLGMTARR